MAVVPRKVLGRYTVASLIAAEGEPDARSPYCALLSRRGRHTVPIEYNWRAASCVKPFVESTVSGVAAANAINRALTKRTF
jgi:hypothetical protein